MFSVTVRDHVMIAHSFTGEAFGPAQRLHGATYVVDASFRRPDLDGDGVVVDIVAATDELRDVLAAYHLRNLDELPEFAGRNTTTEVVAQAVGDALAGRIRDGVFGAGVTGLVITLHESHVAWASYELTL